ncbi:MAG: hypothetical protein JWQ83_519 [Lacunisphaera sp.]|nr:hypothetical protein [Lacunisphaera sp.]
MKFLPTPRGFDRSRLPGLPLAVSGIALPARRRAEGTGRGTPTTEYGMPIGEVNAMSRGLASPGGFI